MHFDLVDAVVEGGDGSSGRIVTIKQVSAAEEYLQDHFKGFPVLPGVLMVEAMVQAARRLLAARGMSGRMVLGGVRALKYGRFVRPGEAIRTQVEIAKELGDGAVDFRGEATLVQPWKLAAGAETAVAVSGRFTLRPVRLGSAG